MSVSKSYGEFVLGLFASMLKDVLDTYPGLSVECERDYNRLCSAIEHHGIAFPCSDLVQCGKLFDKALDTGRLDLMCSPLMRPYKKGTTIPRLFKGLLLRVFDGSGVLLSDPDVRAIEFLRQLYNLAKKLDVPCPNERNYESVQSFVQTDEGVRLPSLDWCELDPRSDHHRAIHFRDSDLLDLPLVRHVRCVEASGVDGEGPPSIVDCVPDWDTLQRVSDIVAATLGRFNPAEWRSKHGPGAVSERVAPHVSKYEATTWSDRLERVFPFAETAFANLGLWADYIKHEQNHHDEFSNREGLSRLLCVPKTYKGPRLIAAEPIANQWCQQIVRDYFVSRLKENPIASAVNFNDQSYSGLLAVEASHSRSHATIDLSEASDRISPWVIERLFRQNPSLLAALAACRTRFIRQDIDKKTPRYIRLRKFSTMGSAVTFPVQTILFAIVAISSVLSERKMVPSLANIRRVSGQVRVFGDDMVVPIDAWTRCVGCLETLGLKVNWSKTFAEGFFRESCGLDAYRGTLVPKVNINRVPSKASPESVLSAIDSHNNLFLRGLWATASYIKETVERLGRYNAIPYVAPDSGRVGWFRFGVLDNSHLKQRWNDRHHCAEYLVLSPKSSSEWIQRYGSFTFLQYFTEAQGTRFIRGERLGTRVKGRSMKLSRAWVPSALVG